ncbi:MAG: TPM domain-containing protein [Lachnospiraceae bacterium]|nr:TPM domain-containing protein [Lachnospiraceae bacterium]
MYRRYLTLLSCVALLLFVLPIRAAAVSVSSEDYADEEQNTIRITNPDTGYVLYVQDDADLVDRSDTRAIVEKMYEVTAYGGAAFVTTDSNPNSAEYYAESCFDKYYGSGSGMVFLIDMSNRELMITTDGAIERTITKSVNYTITDNTYTYASKGDYAGCALEVFTESAALLGGARIAQPMKYVSNALIALSLALLANFAIVNAMSRLKSASDAEILKSASSNVQISQPDVRFMKETKTYSPVSSGSSGGGGGGRSGGGGGGGGHSSGGHRF